MGSRGQKGQSRVLPEGTTYIFLMLSFFDLRDKSTEIDIYSMSKVVVQILIFITSIKGVLVIEVNRT